MKRVCGTFNGTGAAVYLCFGFVPDLFRVIAMEDSDAARVEWYRDARCLEIARGTLFVGSSAAVQVDALVAGDTGVMPYRGGDFLTATNQTSVAYGEGVYLGFDRQDYKSNLSYGVAAAINTWTYESTANYTSTGYFNADLLHCVAGAGGNGTAGRCGEGSKVVIKETAGGRIIETFLHAGGNTAGNAGGATTEVTLNEVVASGTVQFLGGALDMAPLALGAVTPAGVFMDKYTYVNVNDELQYFEAIQFD